MERITIVGLGPIGISIGLGLKKARLSNTEIIGTSRERANVVNANKVGATDRTYATLGPAVDGASLVILDTDLEDVEDLLKVLGEGLGQGAVITDLGTVKTKVIEWAEKYLPDGIHFVAGRPLPKKAVIRLEDADGSLFQGCHYCIVPPVSAPQSAVRTVVGMVETLGAKPFFMDAPEHDTFAAAMSYLPIVLSSALVTSTTSSDSWKEMHRLASTEWDNVARLASNSPEENHALAMASPDLLVHWLDQIIKELYDYRTKIEARSEDLLDNFIDAWEARARWEHGVVEQREGPEIPTAAQSLGAFMFGDRLMRRQRQMSDREKARRWTYDRRRR